MYGAPPMYTKPVPSVLAPSPPVYSTLSPQPPAPVIEVPVEVPVPVAVEPPQVIPVLDNDPGYGGFDNMSGYGGAYGAGYNAYGYGGAYTPYGDYIDNRPVYGPAGFEEPDRFWM